MNRIDYIKQRVNNATRGPWQLKKRLGKGTGFYVADACGREVIGRYPSRRADCEFICRARTDIPFLVSEVERLEDHIVQAHAGIADLNNTILALRRDLAEVRNAASALMENYLALGGSGDCGNWDMETWPVIINMRKALASTTGGAS